MARRKNIEQEPGQQRQQIEKWFDSVWKILGYLAITLSIGWTIGSHLSKDEYRNNTLELKRVHDIEIRKMENSLQDCKLEYKLQLIRDAGEVQEGINKRDGNG